MTPEEEIKNFLVSLGALSEMLKVFYDRLIAQGFNEFQAIKLTGVLLTSTIQNGSKKQEYDN